MDRHSTVMAAAAAWWLSGDCRLGFPNHAGMANAAPACRRVGSSRRRPGAVASLPVLILATAMLLPTPKARAVDSFAVIDALTEPFCQLSGITSDDVFKLPELGGDFNFTTDGHFTEGSTIGKARLTGRLFPTSRGPQNRAARLRVSARKSTGWSAM